MRNRRAARRRGRTAFSAGSSGQRGARPRPPRIRDESRNRKGIRAACRWWRRSNDASGDLVRLDRFEQGAEIPFPEALVALPLDDLEEDRADNRLGEDLQQLVLVAVLVNALAVDEDAVRLQARPVLAVVVHAAVDGRVGSFG